MKSILRVVIIGTLFFHTAISSVSAAPAARAMDSQKSSIGNPESEDAKRVSKIRQGSKNAPLYVKSRSLHLNAKKRVFTYRDNVEIMQEDLFITADVVTGEYDEKNQLETILCKDHVVISQEDSLRATANRAMYDVKNATIVLTEGPEVMHHGNAVTADKITIFVDEDRSEAEGNVQVKVLKTEEMSQSALLPIKSPGAAPEAAGGAQ